MGMTYSILILQSKLLNYIGSNVIQELRNAFHIHRAPWYSYSDALLYLWQGINEKTKKDKAVGRVLSATFADLPGPELKWEKMAAAPVQRLDGAALQIKNLLFVFAGYGTIDYVRILTSSGEFSSE